jgi:cellulose synthase/poly-beta-1,6-N-acetylglucosamine synthase-like glycosyltransferase
MHIFVQLLYILFLVIQCIVAFYILLPLLLLLLYGLVNLFRIKTPFERRSFVTDKDFEFGIIITAHQEDLFIFPLVDSVLKQAYGKFRVYIVADDMEAATLAFDDPRITVLKPQPALHSKIKSIHYALDQFVRKHDAVIILDADNLIHPSFLLTINNYFRKGYKVVQPDFRPKNINTLYARMDAIGDMFNFFIEREARWRLNLSAAIWGSGVAIDYDLYREVKYSDFLGGFDKKLQSHLVQRVDRIAFAPDAILFDEKIVSGKSLEKQRTRWISAYFKYFTESMVICWQGIRRMNFNLIFFGINVLRPPLFIVLGGGMLCTAIAFFVSLPLFYTWLFVWLSFFLSFAVIVLVRGKDVRFLRTLFLIPLFALRQIAALLKISKAKKSFLKTEHSSLVYIDDLVK